MDSNQRRELQMCIRDRKFDDQAVGERLALIGSIKDEILNISELSIKLVEFLKEFYPGILSERYAVDENCDKIVVLERIAESRNCRQKGNVLDLDKASKLLIDDFRSGKLLSLIHISTEYLRQIEDISNRILEEM